MYSLFLSDVLGTRRRLPSASTEREPSPELDHADNLISEFQPPQPWKNKALLFKHPVCGIL